jgi:hypothetical protein
VLAEERRPSPDEDVSGDLLILASLVTRLICQQLLDQGKVSFQERLTTGASDKRSEGKRFKQTRFSAR